MSPAITPHSWPPSYCLQGVPGLPGVKVRSLSNTFLTLLWSQLQEPGSILAGHPQAACGDGPALTPLSLQGEAGSPGQPGLPGPKVGGLRGQDRLCVSLWGWWGTGEEPCAPQPGAVGRMLCIASHPFLTAGRCWCAWSGWPPWTGGLPRTSGRSIRPPLSRTDPSLQAGHTCTWQGHLQQLHPQQPKSIPSNQNLPPVAKIQTLPHVFGCSPALGPGSPCARGDHAAWDPILMSLPPCLPSPPPKSIPPWLAAWTLQVGVWPERFC